MAACDINGILAVDCVLESILDALPIALYVTDPDGRLTYFNPAAQKLSGRTPELGTDRWCVTWKLFRADGTAISKDLCPMAAVLRGEPIGACEELIGERPDGSRFWFTPFPALLRDPDGRVSGAVNALVDITEQKASLRERRKNEDAARLLSAIVDSSEDAIISKDLNGVITSWNGSAERLFGYSAEEAIGQSVAQLLVPADRQEEEPQILSRLRAGERVDHFQTVRRRKDGSTLNISLTISPVRDADGQIVGASKIARDISDQALSQEALTRANEDLRRSNTDLEQFAYSASHDLQEPLRTVSIYTEKLPELVGASNPELTRSIGFIMDGMGRLDRLLSGLRAFLHASLEGSPESPEADAGTALERTVRGLEPALKESGGEVTWGALPVVRVPPMHLEHLFQNIVGNAIRYRSEAAPRVRVEAERSGAFWEFSVRDNGIGIEPEYQEYIFGLFKRLHSASEYPGSGMGLAICQRLVERFGGQIWVESEPGRGSTFFFTLPAK